MVVNLFNFVLHPVHWECLYNPTPNKCCTDPPNNAWYVPQNPPCPQNLLFVDQHHLLALRLPLLELLLSMLPLILNLALNSFKLL
jgi:hypothetical protein